MLPQINLEQLVCELATKHRMTPEQFLDTRISEVYNVPGEGNEGQGILERRDGKFVAFVHELEQSDAAATFAAFFEEVNALWDRSTLGFYSEEVDPGDTFHASLSQEFSGGSLYTIPGRTDVHLVDTFGVNALFDGIWFNSEKDDPPMRTIIMALHASQQDILAKVTGTTAEDLSALLRTPEYAIGEVRGEYRVQAINDNGMRRTILLKGPEATTPRRDPNKFRHYQKRMIIDFDLVTGSREVREVHKKEDGAWFYLQSVFPEHALYSQRKVTSRLKWLLGPTGRISHQGTTMYHLAQAEYEKVLEAPDLTVESRDPVEILRFGNEVVGVAHRTEAAVVLALADSGTVQPRTRVGYAGFLRSIPVHG